MYVKVIYYFKVLLLVLVTIKVVYNIQNSFDNYL